MHLTIFHHPNSTYRASDSQHCIKLKIIILCLKTDTPEAEHSDHKNRSFHQKAMTSTLSVPNSIESLLGKEAEDLLTFKAKVSSDLLHLPGPDFVDRVWIQSDRNPQVLRNLQLLYSTGRLANTGYLSILPVDQGIEHSAGASFANTLTKFLLSSNSTTTNC
jgi:hypothetical protein